MKIRSIVPIILCICIVNIFRIETKMLIPIIISTTNSTISKLNSIGVKNNNNLANIIDFAADRYDLSPDFIIALTQTESGFNENAISNKGYKGLMQIPVKVPSDANILIGSRIFREKMALTDGDVEKAICLYKGYRIGSKDGIKQAKKVIRLFQIIETNT